MKFPAMLSRARGNPAVAGVSTALMAILLLVGIAALVAASWHAAGRVHEREIGDRNGEMAQLVLNTTRDAVDDLLAADLARPPASSTRGPRVLRGATRCLHARHDRCVSAMASGEVRGVNCAQFF